MGAFTTGAMIALSAANTLGSYSQSRKNAQAAERIGAYEGAALDENARYTELQAEDALQRGRETELFVRGETRKVVGSQRVALAAQNIDIDEGSAGAIQAEAQAIGSFDALLIRQNAMREAYGFRVEASNLRSQAQMARMGGANRAAGYRAEGASTLLTGGAQIASLGRDYYRNRPRKG
jgi:hypothetical protein